MEIQILKDEKNDLEASVDNPTTCDNVPIN